MAGIVSKNLYDLLGNDPDEDPDREPEPPVEPVDKPVARSGKRNAPGEAPAGRGAGRGRSAFRGGGGDAATGNEQAFRDRGAGSQQNRSHPPEGEGRHPDRQKGSEHWGRGRGRGGRGRGGARGDRHPNRNGPVNEHNKQADHSWGEPTGEGELADEKAGEAIAKEEEKEPVWQPDTGENTEGTWVPDQTSGEAKDGGVKPDGDTDTAPAEPEGPKQVSYDNYIAEQLKKKLELGSTLEARKPNEGSKQKFKEGKELKRNEEEENFFAGAGPKAKRERQQKDKQMLDLEGQIYRPPETDSGRGGRGRGRGRGSRGSGGGGGGGEGFSSRGRGDGGRARGRGGERGARGGERGARGGRGGQPGPNVDDQTAFPSLGT